MQKKFIALIVVLALFCSFVPPTSAITGGSISADDSVALKEEKTISTATLEDDFADDRIIVVLSNVASTSLRSYTTADFSEFGCSEVNNLTQYTTELVNAKLRGDNSVAQQAAAAAEEQNVIVPQGFHDVNTSEFHQILCLTLDEKGKQNVLDTIAAVINHPDVIYAGPDYILHPCTTATNDTYRSEQWAIDKIKLPQAWDTTTGSSSVLVGVIDSGIDRSHPDLYSRVSLSLSRDFTSGEEETVTSVTDPRGHGTLVAGVIGAAGNNLRGISGACQNVTLVSLRVTDEYGNIYATRVALAIDYAKNNNISILNLSIGWRAAEGLVGNTDLVPYLSEYPGLLICAVGNGDKLGIGMNIDVEPIHPAGITHDNIIAVGASTRVDTKCEFSNYSATAVDLFAPGTDILSCYPVGLCQNGTHDETRSIHYYGGDDGYHIASGTSMAAPYVTGVAALILAKYPTLSPAQIKARILDSVDPISALSGYCVTGGRLNAYKALHNHSYTYTQSTALKHYGQCACGFSILEVHTWVSYGSGSRCSGCGYVIDAQINSVTDEHLE